MDHLPVLKNQVLQYLDPKIGQNFIDCNVGLAGHSLAILEKVGAQGKVLGIDLDIKTLSQLKSETGKKENLILVEGNFADLKKIKEENNFSPVHGILFDLGLSSWQIEKSKRGFSFLKDEPLLMNYGQQDLTAQEIINKWPEEKIAEIIWQYSQERYSRKIARAICQKRKNQQIKTTGQLIEIINSAVGASYKRQKIHFATRTFLALRIAVNDELNNLTKALPQALEILAKNGRCLVISFHSSEDRIVKNFFRDQAKNNILKILTKKPIRAESEEIRINPRSRSAKLRVAQKI